MDPDGRLRQERVQLAGSPGKKVADSKAANITSRLILGTYEVKKETEWKAFRSEFESNVVSEKAAGTRRLYRDTLDLFEKLCKPKLMRSINTKTVDNFRAALRRRRGKKEGSKMSPAGVNKHLRHLRAALRQAGKWEYLKKPVEVRMMTEPEKDAVFMLPEHFEAIYLAAGNATHPAGRPYSAQQWWQAILVTGMMTGMRINEMLTLPWRDVHLDDGYLVIRHENAKGRRDDTIPLHPVVIDHLRQITDFGFNVFDWPFADTALYAEWHRIQKAAEIDLPCREQHKHSDACHLYGFHSLKKACRTLNAAAGVPKAVLNAFMRHRDSKTTEKYYINKHHLLSGAADMMYVPEVLRSGENE